MINIEHKTTTTNMKIYKQYNTNKHCISLPTLFHQFFYTSCLAYADVADVSTCMQIFPKTRKIWGSKEGVHAVHG